MPCGASLAGPVKASGGSGAVVIGESENFAGGHEWVAAHGTEVRIVPVDLTQPEAPQAIYEATVGAGLAVEILINNAGLGQFGEFASNGLEQELSQIRVNCEAVVHLSRLLVPPMVERRRGWVMVVASTASFQPVPYLSTYAATKAFDRFFALGLAEEVASFGVQVTALCPGPTESEFFVVARTHRFPGEAKMRRSSQSAEEVARRGLEALASGKRTIIPYFGGRATAMMVRFLPVGLITYYVAKMARPK